MVGVDKDLKDKIVGEMIQRDVPLMMSERSAFRGAMPMPMMVCSCAYILCIL